VKSPDVIVRYKALPREGSKDWHRVHYLNEYEAKQNKYVKLKLIGFLVLAIVFFMFGFWVGFHRG
jgi:hypothetical protein